MGKKILKKMKPSDYPQMAIRLKYEEKEVINKLVTQIISIEKKKRGREFLTPKKNEFVVQGLIIGLNKILKALSND